MGIMEKKMETTILGLGIMGMNLYSTCIGTCTSPTAKIITLSARSHLGLTAMLIGIWKIQVSFK